MKSKKRVWWVVVAAAVIAALGLAAFFYNRSSPKDATGLASYLPKREAALVFIDFAAIRNSGVLEKLVGKAVAEEPEYRSFVQRTGFDYKRDLDTAVLSSADETHYMMLVGRFDWQKLTSFATQEGGSCDGSYCSVKGSTPGRVISFHSPGRGLLAVASAKHPEAARAIQRQAPTALAFKVPQEPVWAHLPVSALQTTREVPSGTKLFLKALEAAESALFTLGPQSNEFAVKLDVTCTNEPDAAILKAQLEGITTLLQKFLRRENQKPSSTDLSGVLTSGSFRREAHHVFGQWTVGRAFLDALGGS